jgi:lipoprotein-releasing system permease protein|tara:strand:- start:5099 stop:6295 length:1197 start_codon:yes stop_codon:yes gene_type:complete
MYFPFYISTRYLSSTRKGSFTRISGILSTAGLAVGVSALLITLFILNGFERVISEKISQFDGHIRISHFLNEPIESSVTTLDSIMNAYKGEFIYSSFIQGPALLRKGKSAEGIILEGIDSKRVKYIEDILVEGSFKIDANNIIIGQSLAEKLDLNIGQEIILFDAFTLKSANKRLKKFKINGLFHSGMSEYDNSLAFTSINNANYLFSMKKKVSGHILNLKKPNNYKSLSKLLSNQLPYPYMVMSWKEKNRALFKWMDIQRLPILIIFGLITFVGLVNIISALAMIIIDKTRQIGILKSLGLSKQKINQIFLIKGFIIGFAGSLIGSSFAFLIAFIQNNYKLIQVPEDIYFMDFIPLDVNFSNILIVSITVSIVCMLASLWPSLRAGKIEPSAALKYE